MSDPSGPDGRDGAGGSSRRRRSDLTPRQRRAQHRRAQRTAGRGADDAPPTARRERGRPESAPTERGRPEGLPAERARPEGVPAERARPEGAPAESAAAEGSPPRRRARRSTRRRGTEPRGRGPRRSERRAGRERLSRRGLAMALIAVGAVAAVAAIVVMSGLFDRALDLVATDDPDPEVLSPEGDLQPSLVVVTHDEDDPSAGATRVLVLASDRATGEGTVLLVPTSTVVDVPGRGSFELSEAHTLGGAPLVSASLENLLGARFDGTLELSVQQWAAVLQRIDGYEVEVRSRLVQPEEDGGEVRFEPGQQFLDGPRLAEYLAFEAQGESGLESLTRVQQVVNGLFGRIGGDPEALDQLFADDGLLAQHDDPELVRTVLDALGQARQDDDVVVLTLPVSPLGGEDVYQVDDERTSELVEQYFSASRPADGVGAGRALQILNGNGEPGIGEDVTTQLRDGGYRVVLTGNADNFDHDTTRIIIYEESAQQIAIAQDIQERLGVGQIVRSEVPQSVVDITIIVGHDYLD